MIEVRGVVSTQRRNHQLSLIAALLPITHEKGGDLLKKRKGGFEKRFFWFFVMQVLSHGLRVRSVLG